MRKSQVLPIYLLQLDLAVLWGLDVQKGPEMDEASNKAT